MNLKILAETSQQKGKQFERLMAMILDKSGYTNFRFDIHATGMELDIKANHKVTNDPITCECKAHQDEIASRELVTFYGKFNAEKGHSKLTKGFFFSTSGFNGTAVEWYEKSVPIYDKDNFKIFNNYEIIKLLIQTGFLISEEELEEKIKSHVNHKLEKRYIIFIEFRPYFVQIYRINEESQRFVILTGEGNLASRTIYDQILKLDSEISGIPMVNLEILDKVILSLLDRNIKSQKQISEEITETYDNVKFALEDLKSDDILDIKIQKSEEIFSLKEDIVTLTKLVKRFYNSKYQFTFMSSKYLENSINDEYLDHLSDRFKIDFEKDHKTMLLRSSKIFPSVLYYLLLSDVTPYTNYYKQKLEISKGSEMSQIDTSVISGFTTELLQIMLNDFKKMPTKYQFEKGIDGHYLQINLRLASEFNLIFDIKSDGRLMLMKAGGPIKIGELDSASDMSVFLRTGNIQMSLQLLDDAINYFDKVIKGTDNKDWLKAAWTHKGLCYMAKEDYPKADNCFDKALEIDPELIQAKQNKEKCKELEKQRNTS
jgi:tetratricopeptide (TPR) repeat protein